MTDPSRLAPKAGSRDDAASAAARARVQDLLERLTRIDLQIAVVSLPDATRLAARDRARTAAIVAGRRALLDEAARAAREATLHAFARSGFTGTWAFTEMAASVTTARDRIAAAAALEEAAMAAVVEDIVDADTLEDLRSTARELGNLTGALPPGSIAAIGSPGGRIMTTFQVALVGAVAILLVVVGLSTASAVVFVLGIAVIAGLARRRRQPIT